MTRRLLTVAVLGTLALTACEAPLKPDSERAAPTTTAPATPGATTPNPKPSPRPSPRPSPKFSPKPSPTPPIDASRITPFPTPRGPLFGGDVSWPQCPKGMGIPEKRSEGLPMPLPAARFVVIGLTNGPGFVANPCLADQVAYAKRRRMLTAAYAVISQENRLTPPDAARKGPYDAGTRLGRLGNIGYQQAMFNIASMRRVGFRTPIVWLDIEPVRSFDWGGDIAANVAVIEGAARGFTDAGYGLGVYSTPYLYRQIAGGFRMNVPEWRAAGQTSRAEAQRRCGEDWTIQGGQGVLGQWVAQGRDLDITCPGAGAQIGRYFQRY